MTIFRRTACRLSWFTSYIGESYERDQIQQQLKKLQLEKLERTIDLQSTT